MTELKFYEDEHKYVLNGEELPSVTQILRFATHDIAVVAKPWLRDAAGKRGTLIHSICADIDFGAEPETVGNDIVGYVGAYKAFLRDYRIGGWDIVETPLWASWGAKNGIRYAGTPDRIGKIDGKSTMLDIKTGSKVNKAVLAAQLAAYSFAALPLTIEQHWGLQLKKDGKYRVIETDFTEGLVLFGLCMELHNILGGKNGRSSESA